MDILFVIAAYLYVLSRDFWPKKKERSKKENWIYSILLLVSFCLLSFVAIGEKVPTLSTPINNAIEALFGIKV